MSFNPRRGDGRLNPKYKTKINEVLSSLADKSKKAEKEYKKIEKLKAKAVRASLDAKGTPEEKKKKRAKIKKQRDDEIQRRTKNRKVAFQNLDKYKEQIAVESKKQNIGLLISATNKAFVNDLFVKEGRKAYIKNVGIISEANFTKARVKQMDKRFNKAEKVYQTRKASGIVKGFKPKKTKRREFHNGVKTDYIYDFDDLDDNPSLINQMVLNVRRIMDNTMWRHPNAKFIVKVSATNNPFDTSNDLGARAFSLPAYGDYTRNEVLDILESKLERAIEEYDDEEEGLDERFDFKTLGISFITTPSKVMGAGGHKTIQMANAIWFISGTTSKSNCFYRAISFIRIMNDLNKKYELAEELLGEDNRHLLQKINERAKHMKKKINDTSGVSRKTTTEDDIQKWVDNCYGDGGRGSNWKCEVVIYNSVFCKIKTIRPTNYSTGVLTRYEVWCINHHFIPLIRWFDLNSIREICQRKLIKDKEKEEEQKDMNRAIVKHIATEIVDERDFEEFLEFKGIPTDIKGFGRIKWERIFKYEFGNDPNLVRKQINPMNNKIATYDFEATPNGTERGQFITYRASFAYNVLDSNDNFIRIATKSFGGKTAIKDWMEWLYTNRKEFSGYTLYAHNAGKFDLLLILGEYLLENDELWKIDTESLIVLNGAYLNIILFNEDGDNTFTLALKDSFRLLPAGLDKLCKEFDVPHKKMSGAVDFNEMNIDNCFGGVVDTPPKKLFSSDLFRLELGNRVYCDWDCIGLLEVMNKFKSEVYENMGSINITDCLTGASLSKKNYFLSYYDGKEMPIYTMNMEFDTFCRNGYFGGRNEAFFIGEQKTKIYYNDFTSLYPDVGRNRLPYGKPKKWSKTDIRKWNERLKEGKNPRPILGIIKVRAKTKRFDILPLHGFRKDNKLLFPHLVNPTEIYLWYNEFLYGHSLDAYEYELIDAISFGDPIFGIKKSEKETFWKNGVLSEFFNDAFDKKGKAKADGKLALAQCYKIVANSGYGFWGLNARGDNNEGRDGMEILKCDDDSFWDLMDKGYVSNMDNVGKYTLVRTSKPMPVKDFNVAIAAAICSEARIKLHKYMIAIRKFGGNLLYADTDSCICDLDITKYPEIMEEFCWDGNGDDLGSMKNEAVEKLEGYFKKKVMKDNPTYDECVDKSKIKEAVKSHMRKQSEADGDNDFYFDKGIIAGCKQYCLHKTTYDGGTIEASAAKGVARKLCYEDFHHLLYGSKMEEQKKYEEMIKAEKPDWEPPEGFRIYERQHQFRSGLISHICGDMNIVKTPVDKSMRINYLKGKCDGGDKVDGIIAKGYVEPIKLR